MTFQAQLEKLAAEAGIDPKEVVDSFVTQLRRSYFPAQRGETSEKEMILKSFKDSGFTGSDDELWMGAVECIINYGFYTREDFKI